MIISICQQFISKKHNCQKCHSPDHITRHDVAIEESVGESSYQYLLQWIFFLLSVSSAVKLQGDLEAETKITFSSSLIFSSTTGIISLSLGQFKVLYGYYSPFTCLLSVGYLVLFIFFQAHSVSTEYSTSGLQKILYVLAAFGELQSNNLS